MSGVVSFDVEAHVDRVLEACGGGRTLHIGRAREIEPFVRAFRRRAVAAETFGVDRFVAAPLPYPTASFDLVVCYDVMDPLAVDARAAVFDEMRRVSRRAVLVQSQVDTREAWESALLRRACRKHPLHQVLTPYEGLDWQRGPAVLLFERLPEGLSVGASLADLAPGRDLHMDMLREAGRRADAHVARYMLARQFIRPGDRVLDAACGLGYGSALLADGTLAESVLGIDVDAGAVRYACEHYARGRTRVRFETRDVATLDALPAASFDAVVSFETLEHVADPDAFLATCRRLLTPGGRLVCSVPNEWVDETGRDPNPHHLHVFTRDRLERTCRRHFLVERVFGQTAGGGMKLPDATRALWPADGSSPDAEWWLLVGMTDPVAKPRPVFRSSFLEHPEDDRTPVLAFARDYDNPWLVRAMVTIGLRSESADVLTNIAARTLAEADDSRADAGAALCVQLYRTIEAGATTDAETLDRTDRYCRASTDAPHVRRWQVSLRYVEALYRLSTGDVSGGCRALEACAGMDPLAFSPLLATKTVGACFLRGWIALQARDADVARRWWTRGIESAERALHVPWSDLLLSLRAPAIFGLREATTVVDLASQCATGLHLLSHAADRPGIVAAQVFESLDGRASRLARRCRALEREVADLRARAITPVAGDFAAAADLRASVLLRSQTIPVPPDLRIAIFGTGEGGRRAHASLVDRGARIQCFADNNSARHGDTLAGVPIVAPARLPDERVDVIAVASSTGRYAIFAQLEQLGYRPGRDFDACSVSSATAG